MELRRATGDDAAAAAEVWRAALARTGQRPSAARLAEVAAELTASDALLVVAAEGSDVLGLALGRWGRPDDDEPEPGLLHLTLLAVAPPAQRQGLGSALAEALADAAYPKGARRMTTWVPEGDRAALAFVEAVGFEATGRTRPRLVQWAAELEAPLRELAVRTDGLRLGQLLKLAGLVETGSEGKALLEAGEVLVNGEVDQRRGRQLADGDVVEARGQAVRVLLPAEQGGPAG